MSAKKARPVLLAWELGANLGHAMPLGEIARLLQDRDFDMVCFARDLRSAAIAFRNLPVKLFQSPVWPPYRFDG
ncbi:MAG: hypothetical protein KDJ48_09280, partial [Nitratireductor sp.]|nr:hypothetical protein [Nitratireductor sp.]